MPMHRSGALLFALAAATALSSGLAAQGRRPEELKKIPLDVLCAPFATFEAPAATLKVAGGIERAKTLFATADTVLINAGAAKGIQPGQQFYARRVIADRFAAGSTDMQPRSIHTAGWVTIVDVKADVSVAKIVEACDGVLEGDYLDPVVAADVAPPTEDGKPDYSSAGRVILGDDRRQIGATGSMMVIDRGADHGVVAGQRITIYRETMDGAGPNITIGEATVVTVRPDSALMRIAKVREAVHVGDRIALHK